MWREIERTKRRLVRETDRGDDQQDPQTSQAIPASTTGTTPTWKLRSRSNLPISSSGPVLPAICIICKKGCKYLVAGGRCQKEALTKTQTLTAGTGNRTRIMDITKVSSALGASVCSALIGIHTFSGCDSTSAFYGKGKKKTFAVACEKDVHLKAFRNLGTEFKLDHPTFALLCKYVCHLYDQPTAENINEARYKAFCMASSALPELSIPPTSDALHQHCKRANYQAKIMRSCLKQKIGAPSPTGHGLHLEDGNLQVTWMTRNPAPDSVLHVIHCGCRGSACETNRCSCFSAGLCCTDLCRCSSCANTKETEDKEDDSCPDTDSEE